MKITKSLNKRINLLKNDSIYSSLTLQNKEYLEALGSKYNFSYQNWITIQSIL